LVRGRGHFNGLRDRAHLQREILADLLGSSQGKPECLRLETGQRRFHFVGAGLQAGEAVCSALIVIAIKATPVPVCVAVTSTPGINAPEASDTVPLSVALIPT